MESSKKAVCKYLIISLGLKIDIVFGKDEKLIIQENTKFVFSTTNHLQTVVKYLIAEKYPAVNIISKENKFDDLACFLSEIDIVLFTTNEKSFAIKKDFSFWKPAGAQFNIDVISYFEATNLKQEHNGRFIVQKDGFVSFNFTTEYLFLSELL